MLSTPEGLILIAGAVLIAFLVANAAHISGVEREVVLIRSSQDLRGDAAIDHSSRLSELEARVALAEKAIAGLETRSFSTDGGDSITFDFRPVRAKGGRS